MRSKFVRVGIFVAAVAVLLDGCSEEDSPTRPEAPRYAFEAVCVDVFTGAPIEGLTAAISTGPRFEYTTDSRGRVAHDGSLDDGITFVEIETGSATVPYHPLGQSLVLRGDSVHVFVMIPVEPVKTTWAPNLLALFKHMAKLRGGTAPFFEGEVLAKWHHRPVACYVPALVNGSGVDYGQAAKLAAARWMDRTNEPLFEFVDSPPDTGVIINYKTRTQMGINPGLTTFTMGADGHPVRCEVAVVDDVADGSIVYKILLHEFGHTIILGHAEDPAFLMYHSQPLPDDISDDEVRVVQLHEALPTRIGMSIYGEGVADQSP